jgi:hypothetical protein
MGATCDVVDPPAMICWPAIPARSHTLLHFTDPQVLIPLDGAYHGLISIAFQVAFFMNHKMSSLLPADLWRDPLR